MKPGGRLGHGFLAGVPRPGTLRGSTPNPRQRPMAKKRRTYKLKWRSKKANHGRKPCRGHDKKRR